MNNKKKLFHNFRGPSDVMENSITFFIFYLNPSLNGKYRSEGSDFIPENVYFLTLALSCWKHTGCPPKKMFPCLRGYNSSKKGTTIKSKVSLKIYMQFSFRLAPKIFHLDHWSQRK